MLSFTTDNQFSKKYRSVNTDCSACSYFSLLLAEQLLLTDDVSKETHDTCLMLAVEKHTIGNKYLSFDELIVGMDVEVNGTTPELISNNIISWEHFFPTGIFCTIFLKNSVFFIVYHNGDEIYHLRDCHQNDQYHFDNLSELIIHIDTKYKFSEPMIVGGLAIPEFNNIEFVILRKEHF